MGVIEVRVEHWQKPTLFAELGYGYRYQSFARAVKKEFPEAEVSGFVGRTSSFEVEVNGQLIYSKLDLGGFPIEKDIIERLEAARAGKPLERINLSSSQCVVM